MRVLDEARDDGYYCEAVLDPESSRYIQHLPQALDSCWRRLKTRQVLWGRGPQSVVAA